MAFWVTSAVSSLPVLPYFFPVGRRGRGREGSGELECPIAAAGLESRGAALGDEHLEHQDADCLLRYSWE